jgi:hypothetical protein
MSAPSLWPPWLASEVRCCDPRESVRLVAHPRWPLEAGERGHTTVTQEEYTDVCS